MTPHETGTREGRLGRRCDAPAVGLPRIDVIICAYTAKRDALLRRAIASVVGQEQAEQVIVVIDHASELFRALSDDSTLGGNVAVVENAYEQGLSGARNTGLDLARSPVIAFLDDDACAHAGWLEAIRQAHADPSTVGTGGWVAPEWEDGVCPAWLPQEFWWTVGCSYRGLPTGQMAVIRNPIGASMSFSRAPLKAVGGFRQGLGRIGTTPLGCEETEAAIRVCANSPGTKIVQLTDARVSHYVPRNRTTWSYFRDRCLAEGRSKAMVAGVAGAQDGLSSERRYVVRVLPGGVLRGLRDAAHGDRFGLYRSGAIVVGVALTAVGYLAGRRELTPAGRALVADSLQGAREVTSATTRPPGAAADWFGVWETVRASMPARTRAWLPTTAVSHAPVAVRRYAWAPGDLPTDLVLGTPQAGGTYERALLLLEREGVPWGFVGVAAPDGIVRGAAVERSAADQIAGQPWTSTADPGAAGHQVPLRVVITSRQDAWRVVRAVSALIADPDPQLEVVVVEHHDETSELAMVLAETFPDEPRLTWRDEWRPGRAHARNRGAEGATDGMLAFLDDDVVVHPYWVTALRDAMRSQAGDDIGMGLGSVLPLALETAAQWQWFRASASGRRPEDSSAFDRPMIWEPGSAHARPVTFDAGLCISAAAFGQLGGFDGRLGVRGPSKGGDDRDMVLRALGAGYPVVDVPRAVVWREYPDALPSVRQNAAARAGSSRGLIVGRREGSAAESHADSRRAVQRRGATT